MIKYKKILIMCLCFLFIFGMSVPVFADEGEVEAEQTETEEISENSTYEASTEPEISADKEQNKEIVEVSEEREAAETAAALPEEIQEDFQEEPQAAQLFEDHVSVIENKDNNVIEPLVDNSASLETTDSQSSDYTVIDIKDKTADEINSEIKDAIEDLKLPGSSMFPPYYNYSGIIKVINSGNTPAIVDRKVTFHIPKDVYVIWDAQIIRTGNTIINNSLIDLSTSRFGDDGIFEVTSNAAIIRKDAGEALTVAKAATADYEGTQVVINGGEIFSEKENAIKSGGKVTVNNGKIWNTAKTNSLIADEAIVNGGLIFSFASSSESNSIPAIQAETLSLNGNYVILTWCTDTNGLPNGHELDSEILISPTYAFASWKTLNNKYGIVYNNGNNSGFIDLIDISSITNNTDMSIKPLTLNFYAKRAEGGNSNYPVSVNWGWELLNGKSATYNNDLAKIGCVLSQAAYFTGENGAKYKLINDLGFDKAKEYNYDNEKSTLAYVLGYKEIIKDNKVIPVFAIICRGSHKYREWGGNISELIPGSAYFQGCAGEIYLNLKKWVEENNSTIDNKNNIYFITGHSLGGVTADILAADNLKNAMRQNIYTYAFAPPTAYSLIGNPNNIVINNFINRYDPVPMIPPDFIASRRLGSNNYFFDSFSGKGNYGSLYNSIYGTYINPYNPFANHDLSAYLPYLLDGGPNSSHTITNSLVLAFYRVLGILCPVDITVTDNKTGKTVCEIKNNEVVSNSGNIPTYIDGDQKYIYLPTDGEYSLKLNGTDSGTMSYEIYDVSADGSEILNQKTFNNVALTNGKTMESSINEISKMPAEKVELYVIDNKGNKTAKIDISGKETTIGNTNPTPTPVPTPTPKPTSSPKPSSAEDTIIKGDLMRKGKPTLGSFALLGQYLLKTKTLDSYQMKAADMNGDGKVSIADFTLLGKKLLGV